jgi:hypothetical protein
MGVEREAAADRETSPKWAGASVILGVLSFVLFCASNLHGRSWSLWRLPFVFGLFPSSVLPYALIRLVALCAALAAVATGAASVRRRALVAATSLFGSWRCAWQSSCWDSLPLPLLGWGL